MKYDDQNFYSKFYHKTYLPTLKNVWFLFFPNEERKKLIIYTCKYIYIYTYTFMIYILKEVINTIVTGEWDSTVWGLWSSFVPFLRYITFFIHSFIHIWHLKSNEIKLLTLFYFISLHHPPAPPPPPPPQSLLYSRY